MAILKCKMCGGDLEITEDINIAECEYCGTKQTVPLADNEKKLTLFNRANRLRMASEFDKAASVYENIISDFPEEAEAYWGLCLCNYGIEYVDDPATGKKIPTCHRSSFDSILDSNDFEMVMENADPVSRKQYRDEAKAIEELRKSILEVSSKEEPYDIFICYKETDEKGDRTIDSVIAQDVYNELTQKGYRVFFSRITLEDKLGQEYEPYIFAALNSAKIMLAFGTDYEYYNAVWVKNEWSRFLQLIARGEKKTLIPCYKNIDAYDMPREFARLQAQDMGKVGATQDLLRGIEKILGVANPVQTVASAPVQQIVGGPNVEALLKRGNMALEDKNFTQAIDFFNQVLNMDAECAEAYLGIAMAEEKVCSLNINVFNLQNKNLLRAKQFANNELLNKIAVFEKNVIDETRRKEEERRRSEEERLRKEKEAEEKKLRYYNEVIKTKQLMSKNISVSCSDMVSSMVTSGGTVISVGSNENGQTYTGAWRNVRKVVAGEFHSIALKFDGTVEVIGSKSYGKNKVESWRGIVDVAVGFLHTIGAQVDGTVISIGNNECGQCNTENWSDIIEVSAGMYHSVGLRKDGTVVAVGGNKFGQCDLSHWTDIVAISAGRYHTVGLLSNGTVVAVGNNEWGQCNTADWRDIIAVSAGREHTVGIKMDGTIVATGSDRYDQCDVSKWNNIVSIAAGSSHTVGVKADGTVVATGYSFYGQCNTEGIRLFDNINTIGREREIKIPRANQNLCLYCGGTFKGLFTKKCTNCGKEKDY